MAAPISVLPRGLCLVFSGMFGAGFLGPGVTTGLMSCVFLGYFGAAFLQPGATLCFSGIYLGLDFSIPVPLWASLPRVFLGCLGLDFSVPMPPWGSCPVFFWDVFRAGFLSPSATEGLLPPHYLGPVLGWISPSWCHPGARVLCLPGTHLGLHFSVPVPPWGSCPVFTQAVSWAGLVPCPNTAGTILSPPGRGTRQSQTLLPLMLRGRGDAGAGTGWFCLPKFGSGWVFNIPRHAGLFLLAAACQLSPGMFILTATCGQGWCQLYGIGYADLALGTRPPAPRARKAARAARPNVKQLNSSSSPRSSFNPCWEGAGCFHSSAFSHHPVSWPLSHLLPPKLPWQQNVLG